jgi:hypothetical protein
VFFICCETVEAHWWFGGLLEWASCWTSVGGRGEEWEDSEVTEEREETIENQHDHVICWGWARMTWIIIFQQITCSCGSLIHHLDYDHNAHATATRTTGTRDDDYLDNRRDSDEDRQRRVGFFLFISFFLLLTKFLASPQPRHPTAQRTNGSRGTRYAFWCLLSSTNVFFYSDFNSNLHLHRVDVQPCTGQQKGLGWGQTAAGEFFFVHFSTLLSPT